MVGMARWPLVGRDEELALCRQVLLDEGRSVVVFAPAGTGKTRIVQQILHLVGEDAVTESLVATRSAQELPLAAVAALLPSDAPAPAEPLDLFRAVRRELEQRAAGRPFIVAVDDAHLADPLSAALLHHVATATGVRLLVAVRTGEPVVDAVTALWRDGMAQRIDVQPLGCDDVELLLQTVLGGEVEVASARRLWNVTGGNPLYLHEIVSEAQRTGTLEVVHGVWRWHGQVRVGARLRELVELRLAALDDDERDVVALLATGDALDIDFVEGACSARAIAQLQRRGFVVSERRQDRSVMSLDHPLFAEVVRTSMPAAERARWCRFLAESRDPVAPDDLAVLQRAVWMVDGGVATDIDLLMRAAEIANRRFDGSLAERLACSAVQAGAGHRALLARGEACFQLGRYEDAFAHLTAIDHADLADEELARLAMLLAEAGFWGLGRAAETEAALRGISARVTSSVARQRVLAVQSAVMLAVNDLASAGELGLEIAADPDADDLARLRAVTGAGGCLSFGGHPQAALQLCESLVPIAFAHVDELQRGLGWVLAQFLIAFTCLGRFEEAVQLVTGVRDSAIGDGDDEVVGSATLVLATLALMRGDLQSARALVRDAAAALHSYDPAGYLPWCLGLQAQIAGQLGEASAARGALARLAEVDTAVRVFDYQVAGGRAWAAAVAGETTAPVRILQDAAAESAAAGNRFAAGLMAHEALRLGADPSDVLDRLEDSCATGELPYHATFAMHARALADDDGAALDSVSESFEQWGLLLYAAEASAEAAAAYRRNGLPSRAERAAGAARRLVAACGEARTPALAHLVDVPALTRREREACRLAADGLSNSAIAEQLGVGIRTIEGHLLRAMTKLGVRSRADLHAALGAAETA
jgi:DNA-binding CsgD family transcriptional regulator